MQKDQLELECKVDVKELLDCGSNKLSDEELFEFEVKHTEHEKRKYKKEKWK